MALIARQGGAVSLDQLRAAGLSEAPVQRRVDAGWLQRQHRGVLRAGTLTPDGAFWAACLAMGNASTVSHASAGHEHAVLRGRLPRRIDVTTPTERRARRGIAPHQADLQPIDIVRRRGLRFTALHRTLLDLAAMLPFRRLEQAVDEARYARRLRPHAVEACIARYPGHHGAEALRRAVARHDPGRGVPREELERRAARFLRDREYPPYRRNHQVHIDGEVFLPDIVFPEHRVAIELDSRTYHDNDPAFTRDRRRIRRFEAVGWRLVPVTAEDLGAHADELDADIRAILSAG